MQRKYRNFWQCIFDTVLHAQYSGGEEDSPCTEEEAVETAARVADLAVKAAKDRE